ncbi:MAG: acyl-CoA dehydratase activase [Chloroflexota bacterium]
MRSGGLDIGSRYIKYVVLDGSSPVVCERQDTGHNPLRICKKLMTSAPCDRLVATGYGRHLLEVYGEVRTVTEIKAVARGSRERFPSCRTIIDIGGQDTKAVSLHRDGTVSSFEMNDRCAAGTGRFLEVMAKALGFDIEAFGSDCDVAGYDIKINSMCTVFAESEVIGLIAKGAKREAIATALHHSIANRVIALAKKVEVCDDVVFAGGCAKNACLRAIIEKRLQRPLVVDEHPDMLAALGAALYASDL